MNLNRGCKFMKIKDVKIGKINIPLKTPFKTALRTVYEVEDIIIKVETDEGIYGFGEAPPTAVITGDTLGSIIDAAKNYIKKSIVGIEAENIEEILNRIDNSIVHNSSAKAAVDMAIYDIYGKIHKAPLYKLLGGYRQEIVTDITISVNDPSEMVRDSLEAIKFGYKTLKIKVGTDENKDIDRIRAIRSAVPRNIDIRVDANQGWSPKEAVRILNKFEDMGLNIEFVEQPVKMGDIEGLKYVTEHVLIPVMADESVFTPEDALLIIKNRAADLINIKLMKTGGIHNALKICSMAEMYGVTCMIGCMLEAKVSVTAAVHLAMAKKVITKIDLDGPVLCKEDPVVGGAIFRNSKITISESPGLGIENVNGVIWL